MCTMRKMKYEKKNDDASEQRKNGCYSVLNSKWLGFDSQMEVSS